MLLSLEDKRSAAREELKQFIGRGRDLSQVELNQMSSAINNLIDDWRGEGMATLGPSGMAIDFVEIVRDEFQYNKIRCIMNYIGETDAL
jgi:hypothetical protein